MSFLETIRKREEVRSLFGKQELLITEKQLLGIRLKPSEKTRLSRDIRKKFMAIEMLIPYAQEFKLKHGSELNKIIQDTKEIILESKLSSKIKRIILFGSYADRTATLLSDIDIAVEFNMTDKKEATKFRLEMIRKTNDKTDIQVYNILPIKIRKQIDENGKVIYQRKN